MATVREYLDCLDAIAPPEMKEEWDNVGLLCGRLEADVSGVLIALDVTLPVLEEAVSNGCNLVITHHPVIFGGIDAVTEASPTGKLLLYAIEHGISLINAHTNLDKAAGGVNDLLAAKLGLQNAGKLGEYVRYGTVRQTDVFSFTQQVKEILGCSGLRFVDCGRPVYRVAVGGGACGDELAAVAAAGCDTFVTADVKYHQFLDAKLYGVNLIDAGHFHTENSVTAYLAEAIGKAFPAIPCFISAVHRDPTQYL